MKQAIFVAGMLVGIAMWSCQVAAPEASPFNREPYSFSQATFPCQEDEVLMFVDTPSKDRTGCINIEEVR